MHHVSTAHREECRRSDGPEITASMILIGKFIIKPYEYLFSAPYVTVVQSLLIEFQQDNLQKIYRQFTSFLPQECILAVTGPGVHG